ncbi:MAG: YgiT-type zinc finger protein [Bdellovibrionales bacterium]|jgi:putative zinc finger/helix-turn-helix YgiT family protein|nr:YgiT-type zinc finger protein [Bdellovibrionales bacterium]
MRCIECESTKKLKPKIKSMKYEVSGLENIVIRGVKVYECDNCGESYVQYGNIEEIDATIAQALLSKEGPMTGKEIRFLRTWKGYSGKNFATLISHSPEHLYREESKSVPVNKKLDRLVRLAIMSLATDRNYELRDRLEGKKAMVKFRRLALSPKGSHYIVKYA